jgi:glucose-6-phosphate dehydrogenase assembly protein OpcA
MDDGTAPDMRTSVLTHIAWVPPRWEQAAESVLEELRERHPSRTIFLVPDPNSDRDAIDAQVTIESFSLAGLERNIAAEVIRLRLNDGRARAPASVVLPLLISDLPVFLRWRGQPAFYHGPFEQLTDVADRLVVDTREWEELPAAYGQLAEFFDRVAVSDIVWARSERWRAAIARLWPSVAEANAVSVRGPRADALMLRGWLRSRLETEIELEHEDADELEAVALDDEAVSAETQDPHSPGDLLSDQLEIFGRDRVSEAAVLAAAR